METVNLNKENLHLYEEYLDPDHAENIGREIYRGIIACEGGEPRAAMIYRLFHLYDDYEPTTSQIEWMRISDREAGEYLLDSYHAGILTDGDGVEETSFELEAELVSEFKEVFEKAGFAVSEREGRCVELKLSDFAKLKFIRSLDTPPYIKSLGNLNTDEFKRGLVDGLYSVSREFPGDILSLPMDWHEPEISCFEESDEERTGFLLVHKCPKGGLRVELLADWGPDQQSNIFNMIKYSIKQALAKYPPDTRVVVLRRDAASKKLVSYLFPKAVGEMCICGNDSVRRPD